MPVRVSLGNVHARWQAVVARVEGFATGFGWVRDLPVAALSRWEFILALAASLAVGTSALVAALMGSATLVTPGVVRVTYVGVVVMAVIACGVLLVVEAGVADTGPLAGMAGEVDRDALHATSLGLAAAMLVAARLSLPIGGMVAAGAAGALVGQVAFILGSRDLRRAANVGMAVAVAAYLGYLLTGTAAACPGCTRGPWALAVASVGLVIGATIGWIARREPTAVEVRGLVGVGAVLFVMAATFFLVRDPVRASFTVLAIVGMATATSVPRRVLDRSRDLVVDVGCLLLAGFEVLVGPPGTVPVGIVLLLLRGAMRVPAGWPRTVVALGVGVVGVALAVNVVPPWDEPHHGFFLFPMRDVAAGKSLLVDVNAQYGVGLVYALVLLAGGSVEEITPTALSSWTNVAVFVALWAGCAWLLRDWRGAILLCMAAAVNQLAQSNLVTRVYASVEEVTPTALSSWTNVTNVALYLFLVWLCAWLVEDWALGAMFWLAVAANRFISIGLSELYPSTGAWRFGLPWLLVADAVARRGRMAPRRRLLRVAYWVVASTWSLEAALYSVGIVVIDLTIGAACDWRDGNGREAWRQVASRVAEVVAGASVGMALLVGVTRWRAGQWPDVRHYLEFFGTYGAGLGFEQPVMWAAWSPMFLGCAVAMVAMGARAIFELDGPTRSRAQVVCLVGAYGVLQFTYYVFRPHSNNLLHVIFPPAVLATWLLAWTLRRDVVGGVLDMVGDARVVVGATVVAGMALVGAVGLTAAVPRMPGTLAGQAARLWGEGRLFTGPWFGTAEPQELAGDRAALRSLLARRFPDVTRVPMLVGDDLWLHAVIGTRYVNAFPLSFAPQDALVPVGVSTAIAAARDLAFGTEMVVEVDVARLEGLRREMALVLCERGALLPIEDGQRLTVVRLAVVSVSGEIDLCQRWARAHSVSRPDVSRREV